MSDNVTVTNTPLPDYTAASDWDGVAQHQLVKVEFGQDNDFQRVSNRNPLPVEFSDEVAQLLRSMLERMGFLDPVTFAQRVFIANAPAVTLASTTISSGTVTTLSNSTAVGGLLANADQYVQMQAPFAGLRSRIVIS